MDAFVVRGFPARAQDCSRDLQCCKLHVEVLAVVL